MRLAEDQFVVTLGNGKAIAMRPTLRAAFSLNQKYDGFHALSLAIADGSFTAIMDLISATANELPTASIGELLAARDQLLNFLLVLSGANAKSDKNAKAGDPITFDEYHTRLFRIGTGWLGWTPEVTWEATPAEIITAYDGRLEMLKALFGSREEETSTDATTGKLDPGTRDRLNAIGNLRVNSLEAR